MEAEIPETVDHERQVEEIIHRRRHGQTEREFVEQLSDEIRGEWSGRWEFILSCVGYAVGLGNIWRFPYLVYINGGGAFLIPYFVMTILLGIPCFITEIGLGQYARGGPYLVWSKIAPLFKGVGLGMLIISGVGNVYYQIVLAWTLFYLYHVFQKRLPWARCDNPFNTAYCYARVEATEECENRGDPRAVFFNQTCYRSEDFDNNLLEEYECIKPNITSCQNASAAYRCNLERYLTEIKSCYRIASGEEFYNLGMLRSTDSIDDTGRVLWDLVLALFVSWLVTYLCMAKGIQSAGKVVYFTAIFPFVVLFTLFARGVTLSGAHKGLELYLIPQWDYLYRAKTWSDAAGQVFFSLSIGVGGLMSFASYNQFNHNIYRDTLIVTISDSVTAIIGGFAVFSALGHLAELLNKNVEDVIESGAGLAFILYPEVISFLPGSHVWAFLFFFMLICLGIDSQFAGLQNLITFVSDSFPELRKHQMEVVGFVCGMCFLLGCSMCTQSGKYWEELLGRYSGGWLLILIAMSEMLIVSYIYGSTEFLEDLKLMCGSSFGCHWWVAFTFISPGILMAFLILTCFNSSPFEDSQVANIVGATIVTVSLLIIPGMAVHTVSLTYNVEQLADASLWQRITFCLKPRYDWWRSEALKAKEFEISSIASVHTIDRVVSHKAEEGKIKDRFQHVLNMEDEEKDKEKTVVDRMMDLFTTSKNTDDESLHDASEKEHESTTKLDKAQQTEFAKKSVMSRKSQTKFTGVKEPDWDHSQMADEVEEDFIYSEILVRAFSDLEKEPSLHREILHARGSIDEAPSSSFDPDLIEHGSKM